MKILFITATRIGDAVLTTGLLQTLMAQYPQAAITVACGAPAAPLFEDMPQISRVIVLRKRRANLHWLDLWLACIGQRWDLVVDLRRSALGWFLRAGKRRRLGRGGGRRHKVVVLAETLGLSPPPAPCLWSGPEHRRAADRLVEGRQPILVLAPTANWAGKTWPVDRFVELSRQLTAPDGPLPGATVAIACAASEEPLAAPVANAIPKERRLLLAGLPLQTVHAVLQRSALFVGNDSGLMHIAAAAGVPTLGLFGPSEDAHYAPWGPHCAVVRTPESLAELTGHPDFDAHTTGSLMTSLACDDVAAAAIALYRRCGDEPRQDREAASG